LTDDAKNIFDAYIESAELSMAARVLEFDNVDHTGDNVPSPQQTAAAVDILRKARQLRRLLRG
jgi:hypothetical protein